MPRSRYSREGREDARLVESCRDGDTEAFASLVERYQDSVYSVAVRMTGDRDEAADVAQEAFIKAFESLDTYEARRPFRPWVLRIATNAAIDHLRRRKNREVPFEMTSESGRDPGGGPGLVIEFRGRESEIPENVSIANETAEIVHSALAGLQDNYRAVLVLHHMEGMSYREIARVLGVPRNTAKTWGMRARALLCDSLEEVM
ncbi:MAG: sigma-70 family RNA polymerase sigma factor [Actinomycetota bacterium]